MIYLIIIHDNKHETYQKVNSILHHRNIPQNNNKYVIIIHNICIIIICPFNINIEMNTKENQSLNENQQLKGNQITNKETSNDNTKKQLDIESEYLFMNPSMYNKINKKIEEETNDYTKEEHRFYKKRIYQLFKDTMNKKINHPDILNSYNLFVQKSIEYLKFNDKIDILQKEYYKKQVVFDLGVNIQNNNPTNIENNTQKEENIYDLVEESKRMFQEINKYDEKTFRIDNLLQVEKKRTKPKEQIILPETKKINYFDPKLKRKGIKKSKQTKQMKNDKTYEEKND